MCKFWKRKSEPQLSNFYIALAKSQMENAEDHMQSYRQKYEQEKAEVDEAWKHYYEEVNKIWKSYKVICDARPELPYHIPQCLMPTQFRVFRSVLITDYGISGWHKDFPQPINCSVDDIVNYWEDILTRPNNHASNSN